jgi:hypothetical protein
MRYLAMIYADEQAWEALDEEERRGWYGRYRAFAEEATASGAMLDGNELQPTATATTVRVRDGERIVTDGPFAELREQIAGYFVLDCASLDEAVALASRIPGAEHGAVEVRPGVEG